MKILVISDVHINDYPNYEFYRYQRLNWYIDYANRIVEIAKSRNINTLFIAGDFYDKPVNDPTILNVARKVIDTFDSYFDKVYYILGQHDLKTKNYWIKDLRPFSVMNATAPSKWIYGDHKVFQIGGRSVAMMNFNPEPELDWIPEKVDLFIGHVTINTNGFGSDIDYSKFTLGIAGDIHYPCSCNNLHSVGSQLQRYLGDAENGTCVVVDVDDLSWSRVEIDPDNELFTRYRKTDKYEDEGPSDELIRENCPKYYYIYRTNEAISEGDTLNIVDDKVKTIDEIITKNIEVNGLKEVHQDVLNHFVDVNHIDLNFKLNKITIINVRSIDEMVINFTDYKGLLEISALNGGGKSTIIWSINYALRGGLDIRDEVREGTDSASVYLELTYQGKQYGIYRGTDGVSLDIDGEYQNLGSKRDTEAGIYELLPFINYLDSFFFMDDSVSIMGSYAAERRIELLSTYYRLDVISTYASLGKGLLDELYKEGNQKWTELEQEKKIIEDLSLKFNEAKEKSKGIGTKEFIENKISELNQEYKDSVVYFDKLDSIDSIKRSLSVVKKNEKDYEFKIFNLKNEIDSLVIPDIAPEQVDEDKLEEVKNKGISIYKELEKLDIKLENNKEILNKFSSLTCPECGSNIDIVDLQPRSKEEIKSNIYELELEIKSKNEDYESLSEEYSELQKSQKSWKKYQDNLAKKSNLESKLESLKESLEETKDKINDLESQLDEFDSKTRREPDLIMREINKQNYNLKLLEELSIIENQLSSTKENSRINSLIIEIEELEKKSAKYEKYVELLGDNGSLYELVLNSILTRFNSDKFKYEVVKSVYRGREYNDVIGYYKAPNMKRFRNYWRLSRGQRTLVDLDFIRNLVRGSGIIVFDEILKYLDSYNFTEGLSIIHSMNSPLKIITSQNENTIYVDCQIKLTYDGNITQIDS